MHITQAHLCEHFRVILNSTMAVMTFFQTMKRILSPNKEWGPAVEKFRTGRYASPDTFNGISMNNEPGADNGYANDNIAFVQEKA